MRTLLVPIILAVAVFLGAAGSAHACSMPGISVFSLFDRATTVMLGRIESVVPPSRGKPGRARFAAIEPIKGASDRVTVGFGNTSCDVKFRKSRKPVLVFVGSDGRLEGAYQGFVTAPDADLLAMVRAWASATSPADRRALLVAALSAPGPETKLSAHAERFVADAAVRATLAADDLAALDTAAVAYRAGQNDRRLAEHYGRPASDFADHDFGEVSVPETLADVIASAAEDPERIEAFERCGRVWGRIWHFRGPADASSWAVRAKECRSGVVSVDLLFASVHGLPSSTFAAHDFETITNTAELARIMAEASGVDRFPERIKAYERCTRLYREELEARALHERALEASGGGGRTHDQERLLPWWIDHLTPSTSEREWRSHVAQCRRGTEFSR